MKRILFTATVAVAGPKGARFTGAIRLAAGDFSLVSDEAVLARLRPAARDNKWRSNICIDSTSAAHLDIRGLKRARPGEGTKDGVEVFRKRGMRNPES